MSPDRSTRPGLVAVLLSALALAACTSGSDEGPSAPRPDEASTDDVGADGSPGDGPDAADPDAITSDVDLEALAGTPALAGLAWVLDALEAPPDPDVIEGAFTETFRREVPPDQLRAILGQLQGAYRVTSLLDATDTELAAEIASDDAAWTLTLAIDPAAPEDPGIAGLFFAEPLPDPLTFDSWDEASAALTGLAAQVGFLAATVDGDACVPVASAAEDERGPIGSVVKLAVLDAVADAVASGELAWDDTVTVTDERRSLPSGRLQDADAGTEVSLADAAELMIVISDNTATDLLQERVGRDAVVEARERLGMPAPADELPQLDTREFFALGWGDDDRRADYLGADLEERESILAELDGSPLDVEVADVGLDPEATAIGWRATPAELCDALVAIDARAAEDPVVAGAVETNAIVRLADTPWTRSVAKGGSAPGVLAFAWLLEDDDGQRAAFTITLADDAGIDDRAALPAIEGALALLADG
jgi:hypothetical protein